MLVVAIKCISYGKHIAQCLGPIRPLVKIIASFPVCFSYVPPASLANPYTGGAETVTHLPPPPVGGHFSVFLLK